MWGNVARSARAWTRPSVLGDGYVFGYGNGHLSSATFDALIFTPIAHWRNLESDILRLMHILSF